MDIQLADIRAVMNMIDSVGDIQWYLRKGGPFKVVLPGSLPESPEHHISASQAQEAAPTSAVYSFATVSLNARSEVVISFPEQQLIIGNDRCSDRYSEDMDALYGIKRR